jgi:hypothetical protein
VTKTHADRERETARAIAAQARADLAAARGEAVAPPADEDLSIGQRPTAHQLEEAERYRDPEQREAYDLWRNAAGLSRSPAFGPHARARAARELEDVEKRLEQKKRDYKHVGTDKARQGAQARIELLEAAEQRLREHAFLDGGSRTYDELDHDQAAFCRNVECGARLPKRWPSAWCAGCQAP